MKRAACAVVAATTALNANAKVVKTADGRKTHVETPVMLGIDEDLCIFENFNDSWCLEATPPMMKAGWEWAQTYTTTAASVESSSVEYYQVEFQPFVQVQSQIISNILLQNIWVN